MISNRVLEKLDRYIPSEKITESVIVLIAEAQALSGRQYVISRTCETLGLSDEQKQRILKAFANLNYKEHCAVTSWRGER